MGVGVRGYLGGGVDWEEGGGCSKGFVAFDERLDHVVCVCITLYLLHYITLHFTHACHYCNIAYNICTMSTIILHNVNEYCNIAQ